MIHNKLTHTISREAAAKGANENILILMIETPTMCIFANQLMERSKVTHIQLEMKFILRIFSIMHADCV